MQVQCMCRPVVSVLSWMIQMANKLSIVISKTLSSTAMLPPAPAVHRFSVLHSLRTGFSGTLLVRAPPPGSRIASRPVSNTSSRMSQQSLSLPDLPYQPSDYLKAQRWPEEDLSSTADEGAGFYPLRLGETFDDERFVITRKLGWGGYSTVWLARDRKYVQESTTS